MTLAFVSGTICAIGLIGVAWRLFTVLTFPGQMYRAINGRKSVLHSSELAHHLQTCAGCGKNRPQTVRYSPKLGVMVHGCHRCKAIWTTDTDLIRAIR